MTLYPISGLFLNQYPWLGWADILFAYERQFIGWTAAVEVAQERVRLGVGGSLERELASLDKSQAFRAGDLVRALAGHENGIDIERESEKWLFISLDWVHANRGQFADPLGNVEALYADFGYPEEIESFVRYMPPTDGHDPRLFTTEENLDRLAANWSGYLSKKRRMLELNQGVQDQ